MDRYKLILAFVFAILLSSCGANFHLRKAERQLRKAQIKGAVIKADTIFKSVPIITDRFVHDTVVQRLVNTDTLTIDHVRYRIKLKYDTLTLTEYVQVECKPDTIVREVPVQITRTVTAEKGVNWGLAIIFFVIAISLLLALIRK